MACAGHETAAVLLSCTLRLSSQQGSVSRAGKPFHSATSFSIHCKRTQTPNKQGDDGWKSVLYEGQPLEMYRRRYSGKPRTPQPRRSSASAQDGDEVSNIFQPPYALPSAFPPGCDEHVAAMHSPSILLCHTLLLHFPLSALKLPGTPDRPGLCPTGDGVCRASWAVRNGHTHSKQQSLGR